jgi:branched-chain amino acid transport system substrate-binding protein
VQLTTVDDQLTPAVSISAAQTLIGDHVDAIVDDSLLGVVWGSAVEKANIPVVGGYSQDPPNDSSPDFYPAGETLAAGPAADILTAKQAGATTFGYLYCAEVASCATTAQALKAAAQKYGVSDVYNASIAGTAPNYTAQCVAAQQAHVQSMFIGSAVQVLERVEADCVKQGFSPIIIGPGTQYSGIWPTTAGLKTNSWFNFTNIPYFADTPAVQAMNAAVDKYYPGIRNDPVNWVEQSVSLWASGLLLQDALKGGGLTASSTPSPAMIVQGLTSLNGDTLQGMAPPLTFPAGKTHTIDCWFPAKLQNGVTTVLNNGNYTCLNS